MLILLVSLLALAEPQPATPVEALALAQELLQHPQGARPADVPLVNVEAACGHVQRGLPGIEPPLAKALHHSCVAQAAITVKDLLGLAPVGDIRVVGGEQPHLVVRYELVGGAVQFLLLRPVTEGGQVYVGDYMNLQNGSGLYGTFRLVLRRVQQFGVEGIDHTKTINQAIALAEQGAAPQAAQLLTKLPEGYDTDFSFGIAKLLVARQMSSSDVANNTDAYAKRWPKDPAIALLLFDPLLANGNYEQAIAMTAPLRQATGDDPGALAMQGFAHLRAGQLVKAREVFTSANRGAPRMLLAVNGLTRVDLHQGDFDSALARMKFMADDLGEVWIDNFRKTNEFTDFAKSKQHKLWLKWLKEHRAQQ